MKSCTPLSLKHQPRNQNDTGNKENQQSNSAFYPLLEQEYNIDRNIYSKFIRICNTYSSILDPSLTLKQSRMRNKKNLKKLYERT